MVGDIFGASDRVARDLDDSDRCAAGETPALLKAKIEVSLFGHWAG
jgi:hypothetical protein